MVNLIAHGLVIKDGKVLLIKRSKIKRGKPNFNAERWDVPGGTVEAGENPRMAAEREIKEETNCTAIATNVICDMYQYDKEKNKEFLTLVYETDLNDCANIILDPEEHSEYKWISVDELLKEDLSLDILEYIIPAVRAINRNQLRVF